MISMQSTSSVDWKLDSSTQANAPDVTSAKDEKSDAASDFAALLAASWFAPIAAQDQAPSDAKENMEANATAGDPATSAKIETAFISESPARIDTNAAAIDDVSKLISAIPAANSQDTIEAIQTGAAKVLPSPQQLITDAANAPLIETKTANLPASSSANDNDSQKLFSASQVPGDEKSPANDPADNRKEQRELASVVNTLTDAVRQTAQSSTRSLIKSLFVKQAGDSAQENLAQPFDKTVAGAEQQGSTAFNASPLAANEGGNNAASSSAAISQTHDSLLMFAEQLARRESRTFRLNLRPIELGGIEVRLARNAQGHLSAQLSVERNATQQALAGNITDLRESLERAGLIVERLDVSLSNNLHAQSGNDHESQREAFASTAAHKTTSSQVSTTEDNATPVIETENRLLNMRA